MRTSGSSEHNGIFLPATGLANAARSLFAVALPAPATRRSAFSIASSALCASGARPEAEKTNSYKRNAVFRSGITFFFNIPYNQQTGDISHGQP
jgi:hypothetical protein